MPSLDRPEIVDATGNLVEITEAGFGVDLEIAYATADNFTGAPVYNAPRCLLHKAAARLLRRAIEIAAAQGLTLRIFDAYRPPEAQWAFWAHTPNGDFLSPPWLGSPHSRGVAVDLTLVAGDGRELEMGTSFDAFTELSHHGNTEVSPNAQRNRHLLLGIMTSAGWDFYLEEWWHYQLFQPRRHPLISDGLLGAPMTARGAAQRMEQASSKSSLGLRSWSAAGSP